MGGRAARAREDIGEIERDQGVKIIEMKQFMSDDKLKKVGFVVIDTEMLK